MRTYNIDGQLIPSEQLWNSLTAEQREAVLEIGNHRAMSLGQRRHREALNLDYRAWRAEQDAIRYESSDERLAAQGDFAELQKRHLFDLAKFLLRRVQGDRNRAFEFAELTLDLARQHIASYDPSKAKFRTWLFYSSLQIVKRERDKEWETLTMDQRRERVLYDLHDWDGWYPRARISLAEKSAVDNLHLGRAALGELIDGILGEMELQAA